MGNFKRKALIDACIQQMQTITKEIPNTYFLSSTDRKGYTIKTEVMFHDKNSSAILVIEPFVKEKSEMVKRFEEKTKYDFAKKLYDDNYLDAID